MSDKKKNIIKRNILINFAGLIIIITLCSIFIATSKDPDLPIAVFGFFIMLIYAAFIFGCLIWNINISVDFFRHKIVNDSLLRQSFTVMILSIGVPVTIALAFIFEMLIGDVL